MINNLILKKDNLCRVVSIVAVPLLASCSPKYDLSMPKNAISSTERPYVDRGKCYRPQTKYDYCQVGWASWYGNPFHGRPTSMSVYFNKNLITAAHRTLPLPCVVEVTNLDNGKKIKVMVNDRGPYFKTHRRIIDLSERTAHLLGFHKQGEAKVRVRCLPYESSLAALYYGRKPYGGCCRPLTPKEFKYIKEGILRDKSLHCESLVKKRWVSGKCVRNRRNKVRRK